MGNKCYVSYDGINFKEYNITIKMQLRDIAKDVYMPEAICALMDGAITSLADMPKIGSKVKFLSPDNSQQASRVFLRGATFLLYCAAKALFPSKKLVVDHALYGGVYCDLGDITDEQIAELEKKIYDYIKDDKDFVLVKMQKSEAKKIMLDEGLIFKANLLPYRNASNYYMYEFDGWKNYFYGIMPKSAGYLTGMHLFLYSNGFILKYPAPYVEGSISITDQPKYGQIFKEAEKWGRILSVSYISEINNLLKKGEINDFIGVNEALHEKKIAEFAQKITDKGNVKVVLIAGPSSSGKTTFASRLAVHLRAIGQKSMPISVDDYYKDRENIPRDKSGNPDLECLPALDLTKLNDDLKTLLAGEVANIPKYDFYAGKRKQDSVPVRIGNDVLIIEGIHGLNDGLTRDIPEGIKFKIFVSPLTTLNIDEHSVVFPDDLRLIRRLVRDKRERGFSFEQTLGEWDSVRRGEYMYILPYQETADVMFNSTLLYEPLILKKYCYDELKRFTPDMLHYPEAQSLLNFLDYFLSFDDESNIPVQGILREFIGPIKK